jgi:muconolactone delta-isomerase
MQYLVVSEPIEMGVLPPQQMAQLVEQKILPSLEVLIKKEAEGKILAGGAISGARAGASIVEAASNEEVGDLLTSLPFWGMFNWTVTPLESYKHREKVLHGMLEQLKAASK